MVQGKGGREKAKKAGAIAFGRTVIGNEDVSVEGERHKGGSLAADYPL